MKKLGLRAVAGGLALLLTASVFAPATPANAADVLLIAPAPKTLVITADMVDDDGEIVISNEKWDRIIIEKEAAAKDIYFDGVEVGELVVESGNSAKVQLWDVDAEQVTVKEPELADITLKDLATLLADKETRADTLEMYFAIRAKNESAKKTAPTIVTMEDAKVDKMVARANAALDLAAGEVGVVALEASSEVATARVTLRNYEGDVAFTGTEGKSNMILNNVNSTIESLKVEESATNNILTVNSQGSVIEKAEIGGNAKVSLNIPMKSLEVTEEATAANVRVLNKVDEMEVAADSAKVEVTASGSVSDAVVTGDRVNIGGNGSLSNVEITGSDAYVSTEGTKVEGENTYVKPVYVETPKDLEYEIGLLPSDGWNNTKLSSNDGGECYKLNDSYGGEVFYTFPNAIDAAKYEEVVIKVKVDSDSPDALRVKLTHVGADKDEWGNPVPFFMSEVPSGSGEVEVVLPLDIHAGKMIDQVRFQSTADGTVATFYSISFKARLDGPAQPIVLPTEGTQCNPNSWEVVVFDSVDFRKYAGTTVKITAEALRCGGSVGPKAQRQFNDSKWTEIEKNSYIEIGTEWTDFGVATYEVPESFASETKPVYFGIRTVNGEDYSRCLIFQKGFSVELLEGEVTPEQPDVPVIPEGAYTFDKVVKAKDGWNASFVLNENKGAVITYTGDYSQAFFTIPDDVDITKLESVTLNGIDVGNYMIRLLAASNLDTYNGNNADIDGEWDTPTVSTKGKTDIKYIVLMSQKAQEIVVDSVSFKLKEATGEGDSGNQGGTEGEDQGNTQDGTECSSDGYVVHNFTDYDLSEYAGSTVKITVKLKKTGGADTVKAYAQTSGTYAWISTAVIGNEWEEYVVSYDVPKDCKKTEYIGFRKINDGDEVQDYTGCTFYYKDLVFEGTKTSGGDEGGSGEVEKVTVTIATPEKTELTVGESITLNATASVEGSAITWSSSNSEIAKVNTVGEVTAVSAGAVKITASCGEAKAIVDLKVVAAKEVVVTDFYLVQNKAFDVTAEATNWGGTAAPLESIPLNWWESGEYSGNNFVDKLPDALKNNSEKAQKFTNLAGIVEVVNYFEVSVVLTEGTPNNASNSWEPQAQIQVQNTNGEATWDEDRMTQEQKNTLYIGLGQPEEGAPKTGTGRFYTSYFTDSFTVNSEATMNFIQVQFLDAQAGTDLVGTYSIKVVLK